MNVSRHCAEQHHEPRLGQPQLARRCVRAGWCREVDGRLGATVLGPRREELQRLLRLRVVEAVGSLVGEAREERLG